MDETQARVLLAGERARLQRLLQAQAGEPQMTELGDEVDDADRRNAEQTGTAVDQLLRSRLAALERAEARLAAGSYGRSVRSGQPIPDERLEVDPLPAEVMEVAEPMPKEAVPINGVDKGHFAARGNSRSSSPPSCGRRLGPCISDLRRPSRHECR